MKIKFRITNVQREELYGHLYPGDRKEAVSIALCGRNKSANGEVLMVYKFVHIPYEDCTIRESDLVEWSTKRLEETLSLAVRKNLAVVKIHSHPTGYNDFSTTDDISDLKLFDSIYGWFDSDDIHASLVLLPNKRLFGRIITSELKFEAINSIAVIGDEIVWYNDNKELNLGLKDGFDIRTKQAFGEGTVKILNDLKVCVVGCSGTGSPVIEQLVRLGVGEIILVDDDEIEEKNLNRIINSRRSDIGRKKVEVIADRINDMGLNTRIMKLTCNICEQPNWITEIADSDIIFGCVDSVDGRHLLNQISTFYIIPYFDLGVKLIADGKGGIEQICGTVNYIQPGGSSLSSRGVFSGEELRAAWLSRENPEEYQEQLKSGYIANVNVSSPAVISINMHLASTAIMDFLARIHPYRYDDNKDFAISRFSLTDGYIQHEKDGSPDKYLTKFVGRGLMSPLLNMSSL